MQRIGDELVTNKRYRELRERWREEGARGKWEEWAQYVMSAAGQAADEMQREIDESERLNSEAKVRAHRAQELTRQRDLLRLAARERDIDSKALTENAERALAGLPKVERELAEMRSTSGSATH